MDFEFTDDQLELRDNVRTVLASACPPSLVRSIYDRDGDGRSLWKQLVELDWPGIGIAEADGGAGAGFVELGIVVEELGRVVAPGPFLATTTQFAPVVRECGGPEQRARLLSGVASGSRTGSLAIAEQGVWRLDALSTTARRAGDGWIVSGTKTHVLDAAIVDDLVVVASVDGGGLGAFVVPSGDLTMRTLDVVDPTAAVAEVHLDDVSVPTERVLGEPGAPEVTVAVRRALEEAVTAMALTAIGTCRAILEQTVQYAKDREQFGRPIGSFQAVKHRLADMYLAVERASALAWFAAVTIAEDDPRRADATSMAKAATGDCQALLVRDGLQLHGGIGFTWEHDLHFLLKRAKTADFLFGTGATHRAVLAERLGLTP